MIVFLAMRRSCMFMSVCWSKDNDYVVLCYLLSVMVSVWYSGVWALFCCGSCVCVFLFFLVVPFDRLLFP